MYESAQGGPGGSSQHMGAGNPGRGHVRDDAGRGDSCGARNLPALTTMLRLLGGFLDALNALD